MNDMTPITNPPDGELLALVGAKLEGDGVPERVLLVPWGPVESSAGNFAVDEESARLVTQAFHEQGNDLPIDYEHQTLGGSYASPTGQAPAAGWIKKLEAEEGVGIFAEVAWTPPAVEQLAARQYRYLSPVALIRKSDRKLVALHSAALTNKPAIVGMTPIVNRTEVRNAVVRQAHLVRPAHQPPAPELVEGCGVRNEEASLELRAAIDGLRERLALTSDSGDVEVLIAARHKLSQEAESAARREAEVRVGEVQRQGRLTPAQHDWAIKLALSDAGLFDEWGRTAPMVVPLGRTTPITHANSVEASRDRRGAHARAEYRANPNLARITTEEAYVAASLRDSES